MTPSSLNATVEQGLAVFHCQHDSGLVIWKVNGTSILNPAMLPMPIIITSSSLSNGGSNSSLSIETHLNFSGTTLACEAILYEDSTSEASSPIYLLIQGLLLVFLCDMYMGAVNIMLMRFWRCHLKHSLLRKDKWN